jgi:molecular chaperone DnaK (HSP70)
MSEIAIEIGSYSIKALARDVVNGRILKHITEMPSWCAYEVSGNADNYYVGHNAKLWRFRNLAFPIYFKENPNEFFRNVVKTIIQNIKTWAELQFSNSPVQAVHFVTPMYYNNNDPLKEDITLAARETGSTQVHFMPAHEALCKRLSYVDDGKCTLVYDLGYKGLTISLFRRNKSTFEQVVQSECMKDSAGMKIDSVLINDMAKDAPEDLSSTILLEDAARQIKESLSLFKNYRCAVPGTGDTYAIDQAKFNDMISPIISETFHATKTLLEKAKEQPAEILMCGGTSRIPFVKNRLSYIAKEIAPNSFLNDCTVLEDMNHMACEGCFLTDTDIDISF